MREIETLFVKSPGFMQTPADKARETAAINLLESGDTEDKKKKKKEKKTDKQREVRIGCPKCYNLKAVIDRLL